MDASSPTQKTIAGPVSVSGKALFSSRDVTLTFKPADAGHGILFVRTDLNHAPIPVDIANVYKRPRRSALKHGEAIVETTEHCLSALSGMGIDNVLIEINGEELPGLDGSARPYVEALAQAGEVVQDAPRKVLVLDEPVSVRHDDAMIAAMPAVEPGLQVCYELDYRRHPAIGRQVKFFHLGVEDYAAEIAPARTFVLEQEVAYLQAQGFGKHLTAMDQLVLGKDGPLGGNALRFTDEPVRHKILDLIGDLALLGSSLQARIVAIKSGHALNQSLVRELATRLREQAHRKLTTSKQVYDIRQISEILPHRYPMLLVDRVLEIDGNVRALGVKNVTINEPFFTGHYPGVPIMPGVLIVEAMAQLSGILISQSVDCRSKLAILLSLDRVKLRRPVVPGDQLILEAESARVRSSVAHMRCRAYVGQELAAEAEIKFMIVDKDRK